MKEKYICPICNKEYEFTLKTWQDKGKKWYCEHDTPSQDKISIKRHQNYDMSNEALKMAALQRQANPIEEVEIRSYQKGSSGQTERVPKKVIESIEEKLKGEDVLQE